MSGDSQQPIDKMENTLQLMIKYSELYKKISDLKRYKSTSLTPKLAEKVAAVVLTQDEMDTLVMIEAARWDAIQVDEFSSDSMKEKLFSSLT